MAYKTAEFVKTANRALGAIDKNRSPLPIESQAYENEHKILVEWFAVNDERWTASLVRLAGLAVYGWMPTILRAEGRDGKARNVDFDGIARFLNSGNFPLPHLSFLNGSFVGTSKFLHFWKPSEFAIWDSNICKSLHGHRRANSRKLVVDYQADIRLFSHENNRRLREVEFALFMLGRNGQA